MQLDELDDKMPAPLASIYSVTDDPKKASPIQVLFHGDYLSPVAKVGVRPLGILLPEADAGSAHRDRNAAPQTGRVDRRSGESADRARDGEPRLAVSFRRAASSPRPTISAAWARGPRIPNCSTGWPTGSSKAAGSMKPLHRMILLSSAYQQSSISPIEKVAMEKDSENALLWKFNHRRLEAEEIRDAMLAVSGRLNLKAGGPSFMSPIDPELVLRLKRPQYWVATRDKSEYDRRTLYMIYKRNLRLPFEEVFDAPDTLLSCARREQSTHAPQALELLNGQTSNDLAAAFAERILKERTTRRGANRLRVASGRGPPAHRERKGAGPASSWPMRRTIPPG